MTLQNLVKSISQKSKDRLTLILSQESNVNVMEMQ